MENERGVVRWVLSCRWGGVVSFAQLLSDRVIHCVLTEFAPHRISFVLVVVNQKSWADCKSRLSSNSSFQICPFVSSRQKEDDAHWRISSTRNTTCGRTGDQCSLEYNYSSLLGFSREMSLINVETWYPLRTLNNQLLLQIFILKLLVSFVSLLMSVSWLLIAVMRLCDLLIRRLGDEKKGTLKT